MRKKESNPKEDKLKGTVNAGYKIIAVKEAPMKYPIPLVPAESIVLAKRVNNSAPTNYVVWEYVGHGEFRSGIYEDNRAEAENIFNSQTK